MRRKCLETFKPIALNRWADESTKKLKYLNTPRIAKLTTSDVIKSPRRADGLAVFPIARAMKKSMVVLQIISSRKR